MEENKRQSLWKLPVLIIDVLLASYEKKEKKILFCSESNTLLSLMALFDL